MRPVRRWRRAPFWTFLAILLTAGPLGYFGGDIVVMALAVLIYLPLIVMICLSLLLAAIFVKSGDARRTILTSITVIVLTAPTAFAVFAREHDRIAFLFWSQAHCALLSAWAGKRGVVVNWDSWGFGSISGDSFLISAPSDIAGDAKAIAATEIPCLEPDCYIGDGTRVATGFFIVPASYQ